MVQHGLLLSFSSLNNRKSSARPMPQVKRGRLIKDIFAHSDAGAIPALLCFAPKCMQYWLHLVVCLFV